MTTPTALDDVKVLELGHYIAGPYCGKLLADHGAQVLKIEPPGRGDGLRSWGPFAGDDPHPEKSIPFLYLNANKEAVTLNLKTTPGLRLFRELVRDADILVENFSPGTLERLGIGYQPLAAINPRLVVVSISNFGQWGPYRDFKATELVAYALGGLMYVFGEARREPLKHALHQAQYKAGTYAAGAALIALYHQRATDEGQWVDVSIQESVAASLRDTASIYAYMGAVRGRPPSAEGGMGRVMAARDGYVVAVPYSGPDWEVFANFLGAPELNDPRFQTAQGRLQHAPELEAALEERLRQWSKDDLFHAAQEWGLLFGAVQNIREVVESPQLRARGYFVEANHPVAGPSLYPGPPVLFSETPWRWRSPAPMLGQHNREVFCQRLGLSAAHLAHLQNEGVV